MNQRSVRNDATLRYSAFALYGAKSYPDRHHRDTRTGEAFRESMLSVFFCYCGSAKKKESSFHKHTVHAVSCPQPPYLGLVLSAIICNVLQTFEPR